MNEQWQNWQTYLIVTALVAALGFMIKITVGGVIKRLDAIILELKSLNNLTTQHDVLIKEILETKNDHEKRIRSLENDK